MWIERSSCWGKREIEYCREPVDALEHEASQIAGNNMAAQSP